MKGRKSLLVVRVSLILMVVSAVVVFASSKTFEPKRPHNLPYDRDQIYQSIRIGTSQLGVEYLTGVEGKLFKSPLVPKKIADLHGFEIGMLENRLFDAETKLFTHKYQLRSADWIAVSYWIDPSERPCSAHPSLYKFCSWLPVEHNP